MNSDLNKTVSLDDDITKIIAQKREYHRNMIAFHHGELKKLESLTSRELLATPVKPELPHANGNAYDKPWWWESKIEEIVSKHFAEKEFTNGDLMRVIFPTRIEDEEFRRSVTYAISIALRSKTESGFLKARKENGIKGYKYTLCKK